MWIRLVFFSANPGVDKRAKKFERRQLSLVQFLELARNEEKLNFDRLDVLQYVPYIDFNFPVPDIPTQLICVQLLLDHCNDPEVLSSHRSSTLGIHQHAHAAGR